MAKKFSERERNKVAGEIKELERLLSLKVKKAHSLGLTVEVWIHNHRKENPVEIEVLLNTTTKYPTTEKEGSK